MSHGRANPAAKKPFNCHHLQALNQHAPDKLTAHILNVFTQTELPLSFPPSLALLLLLLFLSARHFDLKITLPIEISKSKVCTLQSQCSLWSLSPPPPLSLTEAVRYPCVSWSKSVDFTKSKNSFSHHTLQDMDRFLHAQFWRFPHVTRHVVFVPVMSMYINTPSFSFINPV